MIFGFLFPLPSVEVQIEDVCNSKVNAGQSLCSSLYVCKNSKCLYKCEGHYCSQHGICYVQHLDGTASPKCL